jgi:hypothetical protein
MHREHMMFRIWRLRNEEKLTCLLTCQSLWLVHCLHGTTLQTGKPEMSYKLQYEFRIKYFIPSNIRRTYYTCLLLKTELCLKFKECAPLYIFPLKLDALNSTSYIWSNMVKQRTHSKGALHKFLPSVTLPLQPFELLRQNFNIAWTPVPTFLHLCTYNMPHETIDRCNS